MTLASLALSLVMFAAPASGARLGSDRDVSAVLKVRVTGVGFKWRIQYPGPDHRLGTADDVSGERHLHLPAGAQVVVDLRSEDFAYGFYLPQLDVLEVAIPGMSVSVEMETPDAGVYELLGNQMCGFTHPELIGDLVLHDREDAFAGW